jgi:hypothetical protein
MSNKSNKIKGPMVITTIACGGYNSNGHAQSSSSQIYSSPSVRTFLASTSGSVGKVDSGGVI